MELRRISIQSRYQDVECGECGAHVTIDVDVDGARTSSDADPYAHEDDCTRAYMPDPR